MNERIAILVIHGIGQQRPYETLDHFAHGLLDSFATAGVSWSVQPQLDVAKDPTHLQQDWVRASLRLIPPSPQPFTNPGNSTALIEDITLFEYYWAPITQDKISYTGSLTFLINAGLKPFQYFASNLDVLSTLSGSKVSAVIRVILKELWRQACLFLPLISSWSASSHGSASSLLRNCSPPCVPSPQTRPSSWSSSPFATSISSPPLRHSTPACALNPSRPRLRHRRKNRWSSTSPSQRLAPTGRPAPSGDSPSSSPSLVTSFSGRS